MMANLDQEERTVRIVLTVHWAPASQFQAQLQRPYLPHAMLSPSNTVCKKEDFNEHEWHNFNNAYMNAVSLNV